MQTAVHAFLDPIHPRQVHVEPMIMFIDAIVA